MKNYLLPLKKNLSEKPVSAYVELGLRFYIFIIMNVYGISKMLGGQFYRRGDLPEKIIKKTIGELTGFELAWTFFGYSTPYILFIGLSQVTGAFLLLFRKTKLIGMAILLPILLNIVVMDICYGIPTGATVSAGFYLVCIFMLLAFNWQRVKVILLGLVHTDGITPAFFRRMPMIIVSGLMSLGLFYVCQGYIIKWITALIES